MGVLEEACRELNRRFITFHEQCRPYIILKWAQSADGYIDFKYRPFMLSTPYTQMLAHKLRSECQAILVGRVTAERDRPRLDVRCWSAPAPRRFVLSHNHVLDAVIYECRRDNLQTLLVEGGALTHQAFIHRGLWDEIRVETAPHSSRPWHSCRLASLRHRGEEPHHLRPEHHHRLQEKHSAKL